MTKPTVLKFIKGVKYPATPKELFDVADKNKADDKILSLLSSLPDVDFESDKDVIEAIKMVKTKPAAKTHKPNVQQNGHTNGHSDGSKARSGAVVTMDKIKEVCDKFKRGELVTA